MEVSVDAMPLLNAALGVLKLAIPILLPPLALLAGVYWLKKQS